MADGATPHLDLLELDALRTGDSPDAAGATHLAGCADCQAAFSELVALSQALKSLHAPALVEAPARDIQVQWQARGQAARVRRAQARGWRRRLQAPSTWAAAAIAVLALASALLLTRRVQPPLTSPVARLSGAPPAADAPAVADVDGDGRITVLDAFALARTLESKTAGVHGDVHRDTRVDEDTVNALLAAAVSVRGT